MKNSLFLTFMFFAVNCINFSFAQSDSTINLFPMHRGDIHQFHYQYSNSSQTHSSYHTEEILGDTLLPNGYIYKKIISNMPGEQSLYYLRIDTTTKNVYMYRDYPAPFEVLMDSLNANIGDQFIRDGWMQTECIGIDTLVIFEVPTIVKHFKSFFVHGSEHSLAYGLGRISYLTIHEDPQWPAYYSAYRNLNFARINGIEYGTLVSVEDQQNITPIDLALYQNYPNPFNPTTKIKFTIPRHGRQAVADAFNASTTKVLLKVYDVLGNEIATLVDEQKSPGNYEVEFDGSHLPSGIYFYSIMSGKFRDVKKMILMK